MFLIRLCLFVCVNLFLYAKCNIPVEKLCVDPACKEPISEGRSTVQYTPDKPGVLRFGKGQKMVIVSKSKNPKDYWGAVIGGKKGYVPLEFVKEERIYHKIANLIPVIVEASEQNFGNDKSSLKSDTVNHIPLQNDDIRQKFESQPLSESGLGAKNKVEDSKSVENSINPSKAFKIIEGTTIYVDEADEITPSATENPKVVPQTVAPVGHELNKEATTQQERATIPPEVINLNSNYKADAVKKNFTIENVKEDDEYAAVESKDIYGDEDEEEDEEGGGDDEEDEEDEDENENEETEGERNENVLEQVKNSEINKKKTNDIEEVEKFNNLMNNNLEEMIMSSSHSVMSGVAENVSESVVENFVTSQISSSVGDTKSKETIEEKPTVTFASPSPVDINEEKEPQRAHNGWSVLNTHNGNSPTVGGDLNTRPESFNLKYGTPQPIIAGLGNDPVPLPKAQGNVLASGAVERLGSVSDSSYEATVSQMQQTNPKASHTISQVPATSASQIPHTVTPQDIPEKVSEPHITTPQSVLSESSTIFSHFSVSADTVPKDENNYIKQPLTPDINQEIVEAVAEVSSATIPQSGATKAEKQASPVPQKVASHEEIQKGEVETEASVTPPSPPPPPPLPEVSGVPQSSNIAPPKIIQMSEMSTEASITSPFPEGTAEVSGSHSSQLPLPEVSAVPQSSNTAPPKIIQMSEMVTEASISSPFPEGSAEVSGSHSSQPPPPEVSAVPQNSYTGPPDVIQLAEVVTEEDSITFPPLPEVATEASFTPPPRLHEVVTDETFSKEPSAVEETKIFEQTMEESNTPFDSGAEEPGMLSQITGMFSSWFTSAPEVLPEEGRQEAQEIFESSLRDKTSGERITENINEAPMGACQNPELGPDCTGFASAEKEEPIWNAWIPAGLTLDGILTQSNTFMYLVITAVTVLLFTLGHNFIEKRGKTGPLIAKINKLEHELMVTSKECVLLKDEIQSTKEKVTLYENSANDELIISLQAELEESKKVRSELESSIEVLQQELDAATEAGLDLNKMLSEVLTQKGGSESLLKSVENLQAQLDSQQKVIDEMTKKLGVKNQENEELQNALETATEKSESLEEQLTDIKHNLNLHLKEKEDLTRDLNSQISQLKTRINQLGETKEKEILKLKIDLEAVQKKLSETSGELIVKEEEVKELMESMKNLKTKGNVKLETVFDVSRVKAELAKELKENQTLLEKLQKEENNQKILAEQVKVLDSEMQKLKKGYEEAEQKKDEAEKKLEVLSTYFKEKETQLQKELGLQEALWAQKKGDEKAVYNMMKNLQEEVESYKSQNETLKKEILDQERGLKNQMAILEQKAHENWVAARQAERKLEESKQEMAQLRNRLTLIEKNNSNVDGKVILRSSEELNGVEAASPILHDTSSPLLFPPLPLDPNNSSMLPPGFMPPPMFMPPPIGGFMPPPPLLPGDRRPPPLGRMSSPPLNNRFSPSSPADYPFERMSSPPLSPPGSNYRSPNEDREHYRHRTPPFPHPLHPRNWDDSSEIPGFIPISSQRDSRRDHKGSNVSSEHSSSESLDKSSRHSGRV